jgi:predicted deacylase
LTRELALAIKKKIAIFSLVIMGAGLSASSFAEPRSKALFHKSNITTVSQITGDEEHKSAEKKPIILFPLANPLNKSKVKHRFYIQGGLHGNERLTSSFVVWLANRYLKGESKLNKLSEDTEIDFVSVANPDGSKRNYRYNSRAVNLNRNFSVLWGITKENPGRSAFSEPESKAIQGLFKKRKYTAAIDVHGYINWIVAPSPPSLVKSTDAAKNKAYSEWVRTLRSSMNSLTKYKFKTAGGLGDGGSFEDWAFWEMGVFAACLEMANGTRFAEIHNNYFPKGTDTFLAYEEFIYKTFQDAINHSKRKEIQLSLSEKNLGKANEAGSRSAVRYRSPSAILDSLE